MNCFLCTCSSEVIYNVPKFAHFLFAHMDLCAHVLVTVCCKDRKEHKPVGCLGCEMLVISFSQYKYINV